VPPKPLRPVIARFAHHVWMMDVTEVQAFLGGTLHVAAVFDAFSRVPLVVQTLETKPRASAMARLLKTATRTFPSASDPRRTSTRRRGWNASGGRSSRRRGCGFSGP